MPHVFLLSKGMLQFSRSLAYETQADTVSCLLILLGNPTKYTTECFYFEIKISLSRHGKSEFLRVFISKSKSDNPGNFEIFAISFEKICIKIRPAYIKIEPYNL